MPYPVFLKLSGKQCIVVGAGKVAERKVNALLDADADILVIAPSATGHIEKMAESGRIVWSKRAYVSGDLDSAFLVIAATNHRQTNSRIWREATRREILVNVVDTPEMCNFFVPAVVDRGRLKVAVSTSGASPALAAKLRARFENELEPEYADYIEIVADFRNRVINKISDPAGRKQAYERLFASDLLEQLKNGIKIDVDGLVKKYAV